ncbi:unnamed protein product [Arabidopsis halleri]
MLCYHRWGRTKAKEEKKRFCWVEPVKENRKVDRAQSEVCEIMGPSLSLSGPLSQSVIILQTSL